MTREKRISKRIPVDCPARIRTFDIGPTHYGTCKDLSVGGMTLHTSFVPRPDEQLEVTLIPPHAAGRAPTPMVVKVQVRRCHEVERGKCYEIGLEIVEVVS